MIPQATPQRSLAVDSALTAAWREAAGEVVFSSAHAEGDRELLGDGLVRGDREDAARQHRGYTTVPQRDSHFFGWNSGIGRAATSGWPSRQNDRRSRFSPVR